VKQRINEVLAPGNVKPWAEVRDQLNAILRGWSAYFCYGTRAKAYKAVDHHVCGRDTSSVGGIRFPIAGRGDSPTI
jgi:RNA-directed DNA polymerase